MEVVLDTSIVIKWFLDESLSEKALEYRLKHLTGEVDISVPSLLPYELVNALSTKSDVEEKAIVSAIEIYYKSKINEYPQDENLSVKASKISKKYSVSVYDASYISLAQYLDCEFITADEKLYGKVSKLKFVKLLANI